MKITGLETRIIGLGFRNCVVVRLHTDEGLIGCGETVMKRHSKTLAASLEELGRYLIGKDPKRIEDHHEKMYRDSFWVGGPMHGSAISAVDVALWDLAGQALGAPIHRLLGGPVRESIPVYCHCPAGSTPDDFAERLMERREWGYVAAKTTLPLFYGCDDSPEQKIGYSGKRGAVSPHWKETEFLSSGVIERIAEFFSVGRAAVGPDFDIAVDCHGRLSPSWAIRLCEALEPFNLMFVEEPTPPEDPEALREVASRTSIPIAAGERLSSIYGVRPFLDRRSLSILQVDLANCGGLTAGKKIAALAESHYVSLSPHNPNGPLATAAAVQLSAAIPNTYLLETIGSPQDWEWHRRMSPDCLIAEAGRIAVPTGAGLGVTLADDAHLQMPYQPFAGTR